MKDILRAAIAVPSLKIADVAYNKAEILKRMAEAKEKGAALVAFPELSLTGATCGDLFRSAFLLESVERALAELAAEMPEGLLAVVGAPLAAGHGIYNCAVLLEKDALLGAVPQLYPTDSLFAPGGELYDAKPLQIGDHTLLLTADLIAEAADGTTVGLVVGEDLFAPLPPAADLALMGAEIIVNIAADPEFVGKRERRRRAVLEQSGRYLAAWLYVSAGTEESAADMLYSGHGILASCGNKVIENADAVACDYLLTADMDLGKLRYDRRKSPHFSAARRELPISLSFPLCTSDGNLLKLNRLPFIPEEKTARMERCMEIFDIQATALARRLSITGGKLTLGISGGLDSTLALLVAIRAMEKLNLPRTNILAVTMPCFGTSDETLQNSLTLMQNLGVTAKTVPIKDAVLQHFKDIGHDANDYSVTYENSQARERTQVLMDLANKFGGIVLGTGDLSELALGWCTYNGDHMSMYGVNGGVPKTLVRWIIAGVAECDLLPEATEVLLRVLDTPISPELLPPDAVGKIAQKTEDIVGPYALHDFFLYWAVRYQYGPRKICELAAKAFDGLFDGATVKKWLTVFWRRFFNQQFKRNCLPDGVKVGAVGLSPRGDWQMPSDAFAAAWLREIEEMEV